MKKILSFLLIVFLTNTPVFSADTLIIAAENSAGPWGNEKGIGAGNEIVLAAFKAVQLDVKLSVMPYDQAKKLVLSGQVAGCFSMSWQLESAKEIIFANDPLYFVNVDLYKNTKNISEIKSFNDIKVNSVIGLVKGYEYPKSLLNLKDRGVKFEIAETEEKNIQKLAQNLVTYIVLNTDDLKSANFLIDKVQAKNDVQFAFRTESMGTFIGFSTKHPMGFFAKDKFNQGYTIIKKNGVYKSILDNWKKITVDKN